MEPQPSNNAQPFVNKGVSALSPSTLSYTLRSVPYKPEDNPYIDDEDYEFLLQDGVPEINIRLTNCGIQHMEDEVVRLLKEGASPYFLCHAPYITNIHEDKNGNIQHTYFDVAPMLEVTKCHSCDYWLDFNLDNLDKDISSFDRPKIESIIEGLFNVGACERILHLTDEYICNKAVSRFLKLLILEKK